MKPESCATAVPKMAYTDISKALGIPRWEVRKLEESALKKLRQSKELKEYHDYESPELENFWDIFNS